MVSTRGVDKSDVVFGELTFWQRNELDTLGITISIGEKVANLCFGGPKRNRLYVCAQTSLYSLYVNTSGASLHNVDAVF